MTIETTSRRRLECCCCGESAGVWAQWWNRDTGYGICAPCIAYNRRLGADDAEIDNLFGKAGVHRPEG